MASNNCSTKSSSSGEITKENRQAVETQPSVKHQEDFSVIICLLQDIKKELKTMNTQLSIITGEDL